jgi:hypothetical protein
MNLPAQQKINVQNGTKTAFYNDLETAVQEAVSGDTIYLPGGPVYLQEDQLIIDKKLAVIGAGWDLDSIGALKPTELRNNSNRDADIRFSVGSDGSLLTGLKLHNITFDNNASQLIANVTIARIYTIYGGSIKLGAGVNNIFVRESYILGGFDGAGARDCWINNNAIGGTAFGDFQNSHIYNNVINCYYGVGGNNCVYENNFIYTGNLSATDCIFNNNAFTFNITFPHGTNNTGFDNLVSQPYSGNFIGSLDWVVPKNLKLKDDSPLKNAGTDGTDIGMYGGNDPYKEGAVPFNPHIDEIVVSSITDKAGNLKVKMQVSSQTK